ncbi:hypothetical protein ACFQ0K_09475 [Nocardioides caeni]|uniref:hypothetical protein n=1 Tax=Nocardioides caeni TaxID=574700 RepID=UPI0031EEDB5F
MSFRPSLVLPPLVVTLLLGGLAPAQAAPDDPVTDLSVTVVQKPGSNDGWEISAAWTANPDATRYSVLIANREDGTSDPGKAFGNKDTAATSATLVSSSLTDGVDYWIAVQPIAPATGDVAVVKFTPPPLDTTAPEGSFQLSRTTAFLSYLGDEEEPASAAFSITQVSVDPDTVSRSVLPGDGSAARDWAADTPFHLTYSRAGKFTPVVRLTDEFGNTSDVALPTVWVRLDDIAPTVRITRPARPGLASSWRVIRGTSSDVGNGVVMVGAFVAQKRGRIWWTYDFSKRRWLEGTSALQRTLAKSRAQPSFTEPTRSGAWRTAAIRGLTRGTLHIEAIAFDADFNVRLVKLNQQVR